MSKIQDIKKNQIEISELENYQISVDGRPIAREKTEKSMRKSEGRTSE